MLDRILSQSLSQIDRAAGDLADVVVVVVEVVVVVISSTLFLFSIFSRTIFFWSFTLASTAVDKLLFSTLYTLPLLHRISGCYGCYGSKSLSPENWMIYQK
jgi:hypothetical protein